MHIEEAASLTPGLYIVPTPIGNLEDITLRALRVLKNVDIIYCEDTRVSQKLLQHYCIKTKLGIYNDQSNDKDRDKIITNATEQSIALISDAGTPLISDPGYKLLQHAYNKKIYVSVLPGPCALITGLVLSTLPNDCFTFLGFFDTKKAGLYKNIKSTLVFYISPHALESALSWIEINMNNREIALCKELSKLYEKAIVGSVEAIRSYCAEQTKIRGEFVMVLSPPSKENTSDDDIILALEKALTVYKGKDAIKHVSEILNIAKKDVYNLYLSLKNKD